jgi:hypothetical protein
MSIKRTRIENVIEIPRKASENIVVYTPRERKRQMQIP